MQVALISDIHGNHTALKAVLDDIKLQNVDSIICLGDVATIGPQPRQVLAELRALGCPCIMGNHDAALLDPNAAEEYKIASPLIPTFKWCVNQLTEDDLNLLRSFQPSVEILLDPDTRMLCFHGSPHSSTEGIFPTTPFKKLDGFLSGSAADIMVCGHTHSQMLRQHQGRPLINPGSIGAVFLTPVLSLKEPILLPWAEYAVVNFQDHVLSVDFRGIPLDLAEFSAVISDSDIPLKDRLFDQYSPNSPIDTKTG